MTNELYHHGIKGQRWGVRRFQKDDGTLTPAGRKRYDEDFGDAQNEGGKRSINKDAVLKGAAVVGAVALGAVLITNPGARNVVAKYGKTAMASLGTAAGKTAGKVVNKVSERAEKAADKMVDAALAAAGTVAIAKISQRLAVDENTPEPERSGKTIANSVAKAGIESLTTGSSSGSNNKSGGNVGKEVSEKIGAPSKKGIDKQSPEYQKLFDGQDKDTRATIKTLASQGYDIDQINKYLGHSDFENWASQYFAVEIGW